MPTLRMFDQTVESKTRRWKDKKFVRNNDLNRSPLKNHTLTKPIFTPQSFISDVFWPKYMHLNDTCGTLLSPNKGRSILLNLKLKQPAKLYVQIVFQVPVFDFLFSHEKSLYKVDRSIKHPQ